MSWFSNLPPEIQMKYRNQDTQREYFATLLDHANKWAALSDENYFSLWWGAIGRVVTDNNVQLLFDSLVNSLANDLIDIREREKHDAVRALMRDAA